MIVTTQATALATAALGFACFACFTWGTITHFVRVRNEQGGAWVISLLSLAGFMVFLVRLAVWGASAAWPIVWGLFCLSLALWAWTIKATRAAPPSLAFTQDAPVTLFARGPYSLVRHPFYTSYLLFWAAAGLSSSVSPLAAASGVPVFLVMAGTYLVAARHEEAKFAGSALARTYRDYAAVTGRFVPRLPVRLGREREAERIR